MKGCFFVKVPVDKEGKPILFENGEAKVESGEGGKGILILVITYTDDETKEGKWRNHLPRSFLNYGILIELYIIIIIIIIIIH